jgi:hypothetical protein
LELSQHHYFSYYAVSWSPLWEERSLALFEIEELVDLNISPSREKTHGKGI